MSARFGLIACVFSPDGRPVLWSMVVKAPSIVEIAAGDFFRIGDRYYIGGVPGLQSANDA